MRGSKKIWIFMIIAVTALLLGRCVLNMNITGDRLFNLDPDEVDHIEMFEYGDEETADEEMCKMIIERLNNAQWTKKHTARGDGYDDTIMTICYKNGKNEEYGFDSDYIYPLDNGYSMNHTGYYLGKDYLKDIYELVKDLAHR